MHMRISTRTTICLYTKLHCILNQVWVIGYVHGDLCNSCATKQGIVQHFSAILQFPSTSCPGVAGFVSCKAMSSVFICRVKLLPLVATMVTIPPGSVACRGASKSSTLWECMGYVWKESWEHKCIQAAITTCTFSASISSCRWLCCLSYDYNWQVYHILAEEEFCTFSVILQSTVANTVAVQPPSSTTVASYPSSFLRAERLNEPGEEATNTGAVQI